MLLLFKVATVTVLFISEGAHRLLGCIFYVWNVTPRKWGGGGGLQSTSGEADLRVKVCKPTPPCTYLTDRK